MYETKRQPPISHQLFLIRLLRHVFWATALLLVSLAIGVVGYVACEHMKLIDAFLNSAMLLGGMGPVNPPLTFAGKFFAGCFALYAGLVFIVTAALLFTPLLHRLMHHFHWSEKV
jgi:uncharacterized membrane protein